MNKLRFLKIGVYDLLSLLDVFGYSANYIIIWIYNIIYNESVIYWLWLKLEESGETYASLRLQTSNR